MTDAAIAHQGDGLDLALWLHPHWDAAGAALVQALLALGRVEEALDYLDHVVRTRPEEAGVWMLRAQAQRAAGNRQAALDSLDRGLALAPDWPGALANRGLLLQELRRPAEALVAFDGLLAGEPDNVAALLRSGEALVSLRRLEPALQRFQQAAALSPDAAAPHAVRATALNELDRLDEAIGALHDAQARAPDDPALRWNEALVRLAQGNYARGLRLFEARGALQAGQQDARSLPQPVWLGEPDIAGQRILLHWEGGFGDTLQFCRYAPLLAERGAQVVLWVQPPLVRLLRTLHGVAAVGLASEPPPPTDWRCPMLSLPRAFATRLTTIPAAVPYLAADPAAIARWRIRLATLPGLRVGLVWAGNAREDDSSARVMDRRRSLPLQRLAPLAAVSGVSFVSLQKGPAACQPVPAGMVLHDWTGELDDFADTAALVAALDLVISVDTAVVHLAGALGRPVWVLNRFAACWRWLRGRTDSPWYPTARLFRQPEPDDWASVIAEAVAALDEASRLHRAAGHGITPATNQ